MTVMEMIKFIIFYGLEIVVIAVVLVTLFAALYQLVHERRGSQREVEQSHVYTPATAPEKIHRFIDR